MDIKLVWYVYICTYIIHEVPNTLSGRVTSPVVAYTPSENAENLKRLRGDLPLKVITDYETAFDIEPNRVCT